MSGPSETSPGASQALLAAALGGLLCVASSACSSSSSAPVTTQDTPIPATACTSGVIAHPSATSITAVDDVTQDSFKSQCDAKNGIFETQPECGGSNACRGMSYDSKTTTLMEHTCQATNTCAGYSCVVCD
jgi:hypothetical protein